MIIEYLLIGIIVTLIIYIACKKRKNYESFDADTNNFGPQFVYSAGRIKQEGGVERELDDYYSEEAVRRRRLKKLEEEALLYEMELARQEQELRYREPQAQVPVIRPPPPPIRPPISRPQGGGGQPTPPPTPPPIPSYGQIKEEEPTGQNLLSQIGKVVKKKRKLG